MNTIYLNHENEHIKLVQTNQDSPIYLRTTYGEEELIDNATLCQLFILILDQLSIDIYLEKEKYGLLSENEKINFEKLKDRINLNPWSKKLRRSIK